jgi:hypothetical protein
VAPITESEWLAHTQSTEMLGLLRDRASEKDLWRFAVTCCRRIWPHLHDERSRRAVEMAERDIDGRLTAEERFSAARGAALALAEASARLDIRSNGHLYHAAFAAALCLYTDGVPLQTRVDNPVITGAFDCAMLVAVHCTTNLENLVIRARISNPFPSDVFGSDFTPLRSTSPPQRPAPPGSLRSAPGHVS